VEATGRTPAGRIPTWLTTATAWTWRLLTLTVGAAVVLFVATELALVTVPVIVALILATLAAPPSDWLRRQGLPPAVAASVVVVGGLGVVVAAGAWLAPLFLVQAQDLGPTLARSITQLLDWAEQGPIGLDRDQVTAWMVQLGEAMQQEGGLIAAAIARAVASTLETIVGLVLALVLLFFLVKDGDGIIDWISQRTPVQHRPLVAALGSRAWEALAGFVRSTVLVAAIDAIGIGIGLLLVGVPLVLPLMLLVFIGGFVPVVGAAVTGLLAVLVALAHGGAGQALIVLAIVAAVQQIESTLLQPLIVRRSVPLHPAVVLLVLVAGVSLVGIVGAFLAVPVGAVLAAVANELRLRHELDGRHGADPLGGPAGALEPGIDPVAQARPDPR
jgi:putative heme transporter